ncbi:transformer-2 protein [Nematocida sp. LUAm3]|nr:transformer-2 protein [Nematocida sp. LUAm3]KAI5175567.1 transformer-2 protein [Nematocida sp. LUAm2]KAI5178403.1 transformer-2 protein [Nematocida sp. LUAm1]
MKPEDTHENNHPTDGAEDKKMQKQTTPYPPRKRAYRQFGRMYPREEYGYHQEPYDPRSYPPPYRMEQKGMDHRAYPQMPPYAGPRGYPPYRAPYPPQYRRYERNYPPYYEDQRALRHDWKRRRHLQEQLPVNVLGIFGLDIQLTEKELSDWLTEHLSKDIEFTRVELIVDKHTKLSRRFGFIYFNTIEEATKAKEQLTGQFCNGSQVRVEYSITANGHKKEDEHEEKK